MTTYGYTSIHKHEDADWLLERHSEELLEAGCEYIFHDIMVDGIKERPNLAMLVNSLKEGDTFIIYELTRVADNTQALLQGLELVDLSKVAIRSYKEGWFNTECKCGNFLKIVLKGLFDFERELLGIRVKQGMVNASKKGKTLGRPQAALSKKEHALKLYESCEYTVSEICEICSISKSTLYRYLREHEAVKNYGH